MVEGVDDIFYPHLREIQRISDDNPIENMKAIIADRKAQRDYWKNNLPPNYVGAPPVKSDFPSPADKKESQAEQSKVLRGLAASKGILTERRH